MKKASMSRIIAAGRQCGKSFYMPLILGLEHGITYWDDESVEEWIKRSEELTEENIAKYPAAKKAHKLINSKLYKALK